MSFETKLDKPQVIYGDNVDENIDATRHKTPIKVLEKFIVNAPRGSQAIYCRGPFLDAYSLGEFARKMYLQGRCDLVQRRVKVGRQAIFEYVMVKR